MEAGGIEPVQIETEGITLQEVAEINVLETASALQTGDIFCPCLALITESWHELPEGIQQAILLLVESAPRIASVGESDHG